MQQQAEIFMRTELNAKKIRQKTFLLHIILQKRFQKFQSFFLATNTIFFKTTTPGKALKLYLPRPVQQLTQGQMESYPHGVILSFCNLKKVKTFNCIA